MGQIVTLHLAVVGGLIGLLS